MIESFSPNLIVDQYGQILKEELLGPFFSLHMIGDPVSQLHDLVYTDLWLDIRTRLAERLNLRLSDRQLFTCFLELIRRIRLSMNHAEILERHDEIKDLQYDLNKAFEANAMLAKKNDELIAKINELEKGSIS